MKNTLSFLLLIGGAFIFSCHQPRAQSNTPMPKKPGALASFKVSEIDSGKMVR